MDNKDISVANLVIIEETSINRSLNEQIKAGLVQSFPNDANYFSKQSWWYSRPAWRLLAVDNRNNILGHVGIIDRHIQVGSSRVRVAGVQSVFVSSESRGTGLSHCMMERAMEEAMSRQSDAGLLFCLPKLETVYAGSGWLKINPKVFKIKQNGNKTEITEKNITMFHPLLIERFPEGDIDLCGLEW